MYRFREKMVSEMGLDLITHINPEGVAQDMNPSPMAAPSTLM